MYGTECSWILKSNVKGRNGNGMIRRKVLWGLLMIVEWISRVEEEVGEKWEIIHRVRSTVRWVKELMEDGHGVGRIKGCLGNNCDIEEVITRRKVGKCGWWMGMDYR